MPKWYIALNISHRGAISSYYNQQRFFLRLLGSVTSMAKSSTLLIDSGAISPTPELGLY
jgi:hypothetical protein